MKIDKKSVRMIEFRYIFGARYKFQKTTWQIKGTILARSEHNVAVAAQLLSPLYPSCIIYAYSVRRFHAFEFLGTNSVRALHVTWKLVLLAQATNDDSTLQDSIISDIAVASISSGSLSRNHRRGSLFATDSSRLILI